MPRLPLATASSLSLRSSDGRRELEEFTLVSLESESCPDDVETSAPLRAPCVERYCATALCPPRIASSNGVPPHRSIGDSFA